ncbi:autotransporter-associated N-terminal domain-containing protein [Fusobacterium ulcerans]|uniref:autotransporter-associated N-terminal domain-containing protein n=1 Tax=Fusobacterium ulcerans TaxID=861 RepID=UPI000D129AAA|nr:autotransporter-associated N-terminal domain-containing protein [Fusobacterium ulcerans]AVQ28937.1 autotransporter-associated N-terminal domain-containing protein [Fusobacterium ulcerans]
MRKGDIEKSLKRFLKRKVSYSLSLLIAFMITGGISLGAGITAEEIQETKGDLLTRIQTEREEIKRKIAENERLIKEYNSDFVELVRKGDFYSKPLFNSTQIFFTYQYLDNGKMKDRTDKEFAETIDAINKHYGTKSGRSLLRSTGNIGKDKIMSGNGVAVDTEVFRETIEVGANIVPVEPILPEINKTINITVGVPTIGGIPTITAPTIVAPTAPTAITTPTINVTTPGAVASINVTAPSVPTPTVPGDKTIVKPTVAIPNAVDPTMVVAPTAPTAPVIVPITVNSFSITTAGDGNGDGSWYWNTGGSNGIISQVIMTAGTWDINNFSNSTITSGYDSEITGYSAYMPFQRDGITQYAGAPIDDKSYSGTGIGSGKMGIYRIVGSPYSSFGTGTTVNINATTRSGTVSTLRQFIHFDPHGEEAAILSKITNATSDEKTKAQTYYDIAKANNGMAAGHERAMFLTLKGDINLTGNTVNIVGLQGHSYGDASNYGSSQVFVFNSGNIKVNGEKNAIYAYTAVGDTAHRYFTFSNHTLDGQTGSMKIEGASSKNNAMVVFDRQNSGVNHVLSFFNDGLMEIEDGSQNIGVFLGTGINKGTVELNAPIIISGGTNNVAVYHGAQGVGPTNQLAGQSVLKADITGGTKNIGYFTEFAQTLNDTTGTKPNHAFTISGTAENSIGVYSKANVNIGTGSVVLTGGTNNVGLYTENGNIISKGSIEFGTGTSVGNVGAYAKNGYSITVDSAKTTGTSTNGTLLYSDGGTINVTSDVSATGMQVTGADTSNKNNSMLAFSTGGGIINLTNNILGSSSTPDIEVTGMALTDASSMYRGIGLMADGGTINVLSPVYIKVTNGAAGVASINTNGNINIAAGSTIEVDNGYAVYSDGTGKIDMQNSTIILGGNATAFDIYKSGTNPLTVTGTTVKVVSNDVIVFNVKNITAPLDVSTLEASINPGVTVTNDGIHTQYIEAAVDKAIINVDTALNKADTSGASFYFYNRFIAQNSVLNVNENVTSELATSQTTNFKGQVIALEMNSSKSATSNATSKINIASSATVKAGRTDAGAGAVGAFINYGEINNDGTIEVQKVNISVKGGTGIFATNGSKVDNKATGKIDVYGDEALGIYATAWRKTSLGTLAGEEFGSSALNQGETSVINSGNIVTNGEKSVGIYLENNSRDASLAIGMNREISAVNAGNITVGKDSIGIYASGTGTGYESETKIGNTGTLKVGENSTGMYGENAVTITNIGNLELGKGATGIALSPDSKLDSSAVLGTITTTGGVSDRVLLAIHGDTSSPAATSIATPGGIIDTGSISNMTSLYVQGATGASTGSSTTLKIGASGVGVYVNSGSATNAGKIEMASGKTNAVGMYTKKGTVTNTGTIEVGDSTQLGMVGVSSDANLVNTGIIDLKGTGAAGIVVQNGATITDSGASNLTFSSTKSFGIAADNAKVVLNGGTVSIANSGENIYVYAKNNSNVTISNATTINGAVVDPIKKSVGIYLDGTNVLTNNSTLTATNGAIGVYANGANSLTNGIYISTGDSTVGIYFTNGGTLANTVVNSGSSSGNSVGVYASGGQVNVTGGLALNIGTGGSTGTGMYLADGAGVTGGTITVTNNSSTANIGVYYTGANTKTAAHGAEIILAGTNQEVGIYANGGIKVTNSKNITDNTATGSVGALVSGGSTYTATGNFNRTTAGAAVGYYADNGTADNKGTISLTGAGSTAAGMVAEGTASATAVVKNSLTITADNSVGMAVLSGTGTSTGINAGTINATTGTGVYVKGANTGFNGAGGTINLTGAGTGIVLDNTGAGKITNAGTITLAANSVGVYGDNAKIDFPVTINGTSGTGIYAENGSVVSGTVNAGNSKDTVAVYLADNTASVNGAVITAGGVTSTSSIGLYLGGTGLTHTVGNSTINAPTLGTIGILTDNGNTINYSATTNVGNGAIGMYLKGTGTLLNANAGTINITGTGIGVLVDTGATANLGTSGTLTVNFNGGGGILSFNNGGTVNLGANIVIGSGTGTLAATKDGNLSNSGTITIGDGSAGLLGVYSAGGPFTVSNTATGVINVQAGGLGLVATGTGALVTVKNDNLINVTGKDAVGMYADVGNIDNALGTINVTNNGIGMYLVGAGSILDFGTLNVTKGVGYVVNGATLGAATGTVTLHAGDKDNYSIGGYYLNTSGTINLPAIADADYSIKAAISGGVNTVTGAITTTGGQNKIGIFASGSDTGLGTVTVGGKGNIGVYGKDSKLTVSGITVADSTLTNTEDIPVGVVLNGGSYIGSGNVSVGNNGIGLYATGIQNNIQHNGGTLGVGNSSLGFYGEGTGTNSLTVNTTGITLGDNNSIGVYAKNINSSVTGDMYVGTNTSIGIVSEGNGNVTYSGDLTIEDKGTGVNDTGSVGIYKLDGTGTVNVLAGNWNVGNNGYGIFLKQAAEQSATINNNADMTLETAAVGIFSSGKNIVNNIGDITVGKTDVNGEHDKTDKHLNSIGMYLTGGTVATSSGTITVNHDHSVGVYGEGTETRFTNTGTINVDNGGVGILVRNGAVAVNAVGGDINLGGTLASCGAVTIGMASYGAGATIINNGTITVNQGAGMLVGTGTIFENNGTIVVNNGVGIEGIGSTINAGHIVVNGGSAIGNGGLATAEIGSVTITPDGTIKINGNYTSIGGTLSTAGNIIVDGAYVDVTTGTPLFNANSVSGEVKLLPNFAATGNGISYEIDGFVNTAMGAITGTKLTPVTSPLFIAKVTDKGSLVIAKRPYADLVIGEQFDALHKGLDNILKNSGGSGRDAEILKGLNEYLEGLPADQFERETSLKLAETRGDIYATIQGRMQDINRAFDNSFYELESSYNLTKDSSKYSVIYTDGNYKDSTLGIDDYDYKVMGLLYMKEKEGTEYGSKYGYTIGFAGSKFDFDDGGSKEDVYSLRVGAHRVKNLSEEHKVSWLSRIELGYNRHIAKRKLNLQETFENKGEYNTYSVALDNRLTKVIYTDLSRQLDVYADLDLEYGKIDDFKESAGSKGGLEVQIKDNDYLSAQAGAGVKASQRIYAGNDISVKVTADVKYAYEFGDNYDGNKAKLKNGEEGYYSLITPEEREGKLTGKIGLTVEKANHMGVTFEVEAADEGHKKDSSIKYGVRFNYKF